MLCWKVDFHTLPTVDGFVRFEMVLLTLQGGDLIWQLVDLSSVAKKNNKISTSKIQLDCAE